jgi:LysM repeat protein
VWRSVVAVFGILLAAVSSSTPARSGTAQLTIDATTGSVTSVLIPSGATLHCDGSATATGFLRDAGKPACELVRSGTVGRIDAEHGKPRLCSETYGGPQRAHIVGTIGGRRIDISVNRSDGCGIADWEKLEPLLGQAERRGRIPRRSRSPVVTTTAPPETYQVQRGDTLTKIAKQFHTSVAAIVKLNTLADPDNLVEGQNLAIPPSSLTRIEATLVDAGASPGMRLTFTGAQPSELITFQIDLPDGSTYTGSPHAASPFGVVTTTYSGAIGSGVYTIAAAGELGTSAQTSFHIDPAGG